MKLGGLAAVACEVPVLAVMLLCACVSGCGPQAEGAIPLVRVARSNGPLTHQRDLDALLAQVQPGQKLVVDLAFPDGCDLPVCIRRIAVEAGSIRLASLRGSLEYRPGAQVVSQVEARLGAPDSLTFEFAPECAEVRIDARGRVHFFAGAPGLMRDPKGVSEAAGHRMSWHSSGGHQFRVRMSGAWRVVRLSLEFSEGFRGRLDDAIVAEGL